MIAVVDPENVRIIAMILGHSTITTSERHYNQAQGLESGRRFEQTLKHLEKTTPLPRRRRSKADHAVGAGKQFTVLRAA
jgi:hypothetical protein